MKKDAMEQCSENHEHATYSCPKCGRDWCWSCNPADQASWHGEIRCADCGEVIVAGNFF